MVRLDRIYTRAGDGGQTSLGDGERVSKDAARIWAYGTVDETGAAIGVAIATGLEPASAELLRRVQNDLFDVGADLAVPIDTERAARASRGCGSSERARDRARAGLRRARASGWRR